MNSCRCIMDEYPQNDQVSTPQSGSEFYGTSGLAALHGCLNQLNHHHGLFGFTIKDFAFCEQHQTGYHNTPDNCRALFQFFLDGNSAHVDIQSGSHHDWFLFPQPADPG